MKKIVQMIVIVKIVQFVHTVYLSFDHGEIRRSDDGEASRKEVNNIKITKSVVNVIRPFALFNLSPDMIVIES